MKHGSGRTMPRLLLAVIAGSVLHGCVPDSGNKADSTKDEKALIAPAPDMGAPPPTMPAIARDNGTKDAPASEAAVTQAPPPLPPVTDLPTAPEEPAPRRSFKAPPDLPASNVAADVTAFPPEVTDFMVDRDGCDHFRGEEPYDEERRAYLEESIRELCTGTDARLAKLRKRYAANPDVLAALSGYEDRIEETAGY